MNRIFDFFKKTKDNELVSIKAFDQNNPSPFDLNILASPVPGKSQAGGKKPKIIHLTRFDTPLGNMYACGVKEGICMLDYADKKDLPQEFEALKRFLNGIILPGKCVHFKSLLKQLREYFIGKRKGFTVPLVITGTEFQQFVWKDLQKIPFGSTFSYTEQAAGLKKSSAIRAIAHANAMNRLAILIPCHRVIGIDGDLRGYSGGHGRKEWLIEFERNVRYGQSSIDNRLLFPDQKTSGF